MRFNPLDYPVMLSELEWNRFSAWGLHTPFARFLVQLLKPRLFVELGTHYGTSYCAFCQAVKELKLPTVCYAVDTWAGDEHAGFYDETIFESLRNYHNPIYGDFSTLIRKSFDEAQPHFEDGSIDLLHIDGLHTYDAVRHDYENWLPKMSQRGVVMLHDINEYMGDFGVWKLWDELSSQYPSFAFLHAHGLGIVAVGEEVPEELNVLFNATHEETLQYRRFFHLAGQHVVRAYQQQDTINHTNANIQQRDEVLSQQHKELEQLKGQLSALQNENHTLQQKLTSQITEMQQDLQSEKEALQYDLMQYMGAEQRQLEMEARLREVYQSTSWRMTKPIRFMSRRFSVIIHPFKRVVRFFLPNSLIQRTRKAVTNDAKLDDIGEKIRLLRESNLFDAEWYLDQYHDVIGAGISPEEHYMLYGAKEGRNPGPQFDTAYYLKSYMDVAYKGENPLVHYIRYGYKEKRRPLPPHLMQSGILQKKPKVLLPQAPTDSEWDSLQPSDNLKNACVDVVIPVYGQYDLTLRCIYTVLKAQQENAFEVIVVDDVGPDAALAAKLDELSEKGLITLVRNASNLGFVASVNRGMSYHSDRDVILLNSDTAVYGNWIDRLLDVAAQDERIATITPFSNNAEICSYPRPIIDNDYILEVDDPTLDSLAASVNAGELVDIPTGVGFCMYVRRACLDKLGLFNAEKFGRGYGEENDFCLRAAGAGWRNVMAGNIFVRHYGGKSFSSEKSDRVKAAVRLINQLHPGYDEKIQDFIRKDPLAHLRARIDMARVRHKANGQSILFIGHNRGGGTERHMHEMAEQVTSEGDNVFFLKMVERPLSRFLIMEDVTPAKLFFEVPGLEDLPNLSDFTIPIDLDRLTDLLRLVDLRLIHMHHTIDAGAHSPEFLRLLANNLNVDYDFTIHDYITICPRVNLVDGSGVYCGEPAVSQCERCIAQNGSIVGRVSVSKWREQHARLLSGARRVYVPNIDVANRLSRYFPQVNFLVKPHSYHPQHQVLTQRTYAKPNTKRRIIVLGAIGEVKGMQVLLEVARYAASSKLPLEFIVVGYTGDDRLFEQLPNVQITGRYGEEHIFDMLNTYNGDIAWFPAVWPETFSYTLSIALEASLYPVAFDLGAIAQRINEIDWGTIVPNDLLKQPQRVAEILATVEIPQPPANVLQMITQTYDNVLHDYYDLEPAKPVLKAPS